MGVILSDLWEPQKTGVKSKNGQGVPASRKADEVRLYALRGGLTTKMVRTAHFRSHEVFRGELIIYYHCITLRSGMQHVTGQILAQKGQKRSRLMGSVETFETISWLGLAKPTLRA